MNCLSEQWTPHPQRDQQKPKSQGTECHKVPIHSKGTSLISNNFCKAKFWFWCIPAEKRYPLNHSLKKNFFYLFLATLGLHCYTQAFSNCGVRGLLFIAMHGLFTAVASFVEEHGLSSLSSVVVAHGLSCSEAWGIFPDQGSNWCPLHCKVNSWLHQALVAAARFLVQCTGFS